MGGINKNGNKRSTNKIKENNIIGDAVKLHWQVCNNCKNNREMCHKCDNGSEFEPYHNE